jgi:A/G-specific adenine glycosylase
MVLAIRAGGHVLLEQRPPHGIWGGLWGLPEFPSADAAREWSLRALQIRAPAAQRLGTLRHSFTHFDLEIEPIRIECEGASGVTESARYVWYDPAAPQRVGIAAPVRTLIETALPGG